MKKFIYTCPRCGHQWVRFIPRRKMKCRFCSEVWHTRGKRSSRSRFSWTATFLWLFWIALILAVVFGHRQIINFGKNFIETHPIIKPGVKSNRGAEVPGIDFFEEQKQRELERKRQAEMEAQKEARENGEETVGSDSSDVATPDAEIPAAETPELELPSDAPLDDQLGSIPGE